MAMWLSKEEKNVFCKSFIQFIKRSLRRHGRTSTLQERRLVTLRMARVRQNFDSPSPIADISASVHEVLKPIGLSSKITPADTVAVTAGSRGIANISEIIRSVVNELKSVDAVGWLAPILQVELLRELGITKKSVGVPIKSSMQVTRVGCCHRHYG